MNKFVFALLLFPALSFAEDCQKIPDYVKMVECYKNNATQIDATLNTTYKQILKQANSPEVKQEYPNAYNFIIQNQRDWLKYAQNYCDTKAMASKEINQGSYYPTAVNSCFNDLSIDRIQQLKNFSCEEGDMSSTCLFFNH